MEQVASQCCGGFPRQLLQETTGRLEQDCGTISDATSTTTTSYKYKLLIYVKFNYSKPDVVCKGQGYILYRLLKY